MKPIGFNNRDHGDMVRALRLSSGVDGRPCESTFGLRSHFSRQFNPGSLDLLLVIDISACRQRVPFDPIG
jgi:hypothetical protein